MLFNGSNEGKAHRSHYFEGSCFSVALLLRGFTRMQLLPFFKQLLFTFFGVLYDRFINGTNLNAFGFVIVAHALGTLVGVDYIGGITFTYGVIDIALSFTGAATYALIGYFVCHVYLLPVLIIFVIDSL
jgi:hypothetical protein